MKMIALLPALVAVVACGKVTGTAAIDTSCTMNGFGDGRCQFTNSEERTGSVCGKVLVTATTITDEYTLKAIETQTNIARHQADGSGIPIQQTEAWRSREWLRNKELAKLPSAESSVFCSGEVASRSTVTVEFSIPAVHEMCSAAYTDYESWGEVCSFEFLEETP